MSKYSTLIVGLGNPGEKYSTTRHNFGFLAIDALIDSSTTKCTRLTSNNIFDSWECRFSTNTSPLILVKPLTFMNKSGEAVGSLSRKYNISGKDIFILHDDMDIALGKMKFKFSGGSSGHNGIKSIAEHLASSDFFRLRLGVGRPETKTGYSDYVLESFTDAEMRIAQDVSAAIPEGFMILLRRGVQHATQYFNSYSSPSAQSEPAQLDSSS